MPPRCQATRYDIHGSSACGAVNSPKRFFEVIAANTFAKEKPHPDVMAFLRGRIAELPVERADFERWAACLAQSGPDRPREERYDRGSHQGAYGRRLISLQINPSARLLLCDNDGGLRFALPAKHICCAFPHVHNKRGAEARETGSRPPAHARIDDAERTRLE